MEMEGRVPLSLSQASTGFPGREREGKRHA